MKRALTPKNVLDKKYKVLPWCGEWEEVFGRPADNARWFISGPSASGKSSFVMQLAKELCKYGRVLYLSKEEGVNQSFQRRMQYLHMNEVQGKMRVVVEDSYEELIERLKLSKGPKFVIVDSFQCAEWTYEQARDICARFPLKCFIFISQEEKGQPSGAGARKLKYLSDVKVRVVGYRAMCLGRAIGESGASYIVWAEGVVQTSNSI